MMSMFRGLICATACAVPVMAQADLLGSRLYINYCAMCHGNRAEGGSGKGVRGDQNGPALNRLAERNGGEMPVAEIMAYVDGTREVSGHNSSMPVWSAEFEDFFSQGPLNKSRESHSWIASIVRHLETLQVGR